MGFWTKVGLHIAVKGFGTQYQGAKVASDAVKAAGIDSEGVKMASALGGAFAGSVIGGIRIFSPLSIIDSLMSSEAELEEKLKEMDWEKI